MRKGLQECADISLRYTTLRESSYPLSPSGQVTDFTEDDEEVETPRVCIACGGRSCRWCSRGYQDREQQEAWAKFRVRSRKISSTYSLLEKIVRELIDSLDALGDRELADQGRKCLEDWM